MCFFLKTTTPVLNTVNDFLSNSKSKFGYLDLDVRSISLFRIIVGISLLYNLIVLKWSYAVEFFGKDRIVPIEVMQTLNGRISFSVFDIIQNNTFALAYILITIICAFFFTIGYKSKLFSIVTLVLYWNILQSNSSFCSGYDYYTFQLLFWACFLPVGNFFAVSKSKKISKPFFSICLALIFQITCVYFITGLSKYGDSWKGGYAVRNMLLDKWETYYFASLVVDKPYLYKPLTYITLFFEVLFPIFIFLPSPKSVFRYLAIFFLVSFHLSILLMYDVANFSISGFAAAAVLLPANFWDSFYEIKKENLLDTVRKWNHFVLILFSAFSIYIIFIKNLEYSTLYTEMQYWRSVENIKSVVKKLNVPPPVRVSYFMQNWKMFAPDPPTKLGWISFEIKKEDGFSYDLMTDQLITDVPTIYWYPSGYERYLIYRCRNYAITQDFKYKLFLRYWIPYKLKKINPDIDTKKVLFVDYYFLPGDQSVPHKLPLIKQTLPVDSINNFFKSIPVEDN